MRFRELTNIVAYMSLKRFILSEELHSCQLLFSGKTVDGPGVDEVQETADGWSRSCILLVTLKSTSNDAF